MKPTPFDVAQVNKLIANRRSIKPERFTEEKIDRAVIDQLLQNAHWAPTHGMNQPWLFKIFTGDKMKDLSEFIGKWYTTHRTGEAYKQKTFDKLTKRPFQASHVIALCMKRKPDTKIPVMEDIEAVACAIQNIYLTATAYGVAPYWSSGGPTYYPETKDFLGLGEQDQCLGFLYLGYSNVKPTGSRQDISNNIEWM